MRRVSVQSVGQMYAARLVTVAGAARVVSQIPRFSVARSFSCRSGSHRSKLTMHRSGSILTNFIGRSIASGFGRLLVLSDSIGAGRSLAQPGESGPRVQPSAKLPRTHAHPFLACTPTSSNAPSADRVLGVS